MTKHLIAVLAVVAALTPTAHAAMPTYAGDLCEFFSYVDPTGGARTETGRLYGGPLAVADLPTMLGSAGEDVLGNPVSVRLDCTISADAVPIAATSGSGKVLVVAPPVPLAYSVDTNYLTMCSAVTITQLGGSPERYYWDYAANRFTTDPAATCYTYQFACPLSSENCGGGGPSTEEYVDLLVCPVFALVFPPEGDVVLPDPVGPIWDCPPYGNV
jgi:hypothetical protein